LTGFSWIIVSQLFRCIPTAPAAPDWLGQSFLTLAPTRLISFRTRAAKLLNCTTLTPTQLTLRVSLCPGSFSGRGLRRFWLLAGKGFRFLSFLQMDEGIAPPPEGYGRRCAFPRRSVSFWDTESFTPSYAFGLRPNNNLYPFVNPAGPLIRFHG
jgi:hypothetical protein